MDPLQKQMLDDVFDAFSMLSNGAIVSMMHVQGNTTRWSPAGVELIGLSGEYIENGSMDWADYLHPDDRKRYYEVMAPLISGERHSYDLAYRVRTKSGEYMNFRAVGAVLRDEQGNSSLIGGLLINQGLTEMTDPVTVLPNANAFNKDLGDLIGSNDPFYALQVGTGHFNDINNIHGYSFGNRVLQEMAWLIQDTVKSRGKVYRIKEATFAVLFVKSVSRDQAAAIYDHIRYLFQRGIMVNGVKNILSANGGLISGFGGMNSDSDASYICSCLNYAYEESMQRSHGDLVDFNGSINYEGTASLDLISRIRDCIINDCEGFRLEYDPVIGVENEELKGAEASIFWEDEKHGRVSPDDFIPLLERDLIFEELGDFILENALKDSVKLMTYDPGFLLCVNVYRIQLDSDYFIENLLKLLSETGFPSGQLSLKFSSDCRFIGIDRMRKIIEKLHEHKIIVIIDDFGSGTDSIGFLKSEPVDAVSLSRRFAEGITDNERDFKITDSLIKMAAACVDHINMKGVDSAEILERAKQLNLTTMQGKYFSEKLTSDDFIEKYYSEQRK